MAQRGSQLDPLKFSCSICLDLLKDPLTAPCGHSYCSSCIQSHWDEEKKKGIYSCPQCRKEFRQRPDLEKNLLLAELLHDPEKEKPRLPCDHFVFIISGMKHDQKLVKVSIRLVNILSLVWARCN
uniref:RING-type domain-containing protein n=1 Tax=Salarias fasciatus TaxID=181472 RepID=A0A672HJI0_SALFA